ncbi:MAG: putative metal-binding motif-containing protein [Sandaracinaceae bacterium]|nr:putative metal-binding motif-containing protein [Sandaracinaceae bacterium]
MRAVVFACGAFVVACGGGTQPGQDGAVDGSPDAIVDPACAGRTDGEACGGDGRICVGGACVASSCGDGFTDSTRSEECDDGNTTAFDGCEPDCSFSCEADAECDDDNPCTGDDTCDTTTHVCEAGTAPPPGSPCSTSTQPDGVCSAADSSTCIAPGCGNAVVDGSEDCDDGMNGNDNDGCRDDCTFSCVTDEDCSDSDVCTGLERCEASTHACAAGTALTCTASDACHVAGCDTVNGCFESLMDGDGDGHAPMAAGPCGDDCDDANAARYPGAEELCDGIDNNCNVSVDEVAPTWYVDCDGDGYAASTDSSRESCAEPAPSATGCPTASPRWTSRRPTAADDTDCDDRNSARSPGAAEVAGDEVDQSCDGGELCVLDNDDDGFRRPDGATIASGNLSCGDAREARANEPATDCNDSDASIRPGATEIVADNIDQSCDGRETCYVDSDDDGYRLTTTLTSADSDCLDSGEAVAGDATGDCCDSDANARPGTTSYRTTRNACGSFDYNCSGAEEPRYGIARCTNVANCTSLTTGFLGTVACGASGALVQSCAGEFDPELRRWLCYPDDTTTVTATQPCR